MVPVVAARVELGRAPEVLDHGFDYVFSCAPRKKPRVNPGLGFVPAIPLELDLHAQLHPSRRQEAATDVEAGRISVSRQNALVGAIVEKVQSIEKQPDSGLGTDAELLLKPDIQQVPWIHRPATVPQLRIDGGGEPQVGNPDRPRICSAASLPGGRARARARDPNR